MLDKEQILWFCKEKESPKHTKKRDPKAAVSPACVLAHTKQRAYRRDKNSEGCVIIFRFMTQPSCLCCKKRE